MEIARDMLPLKIVPKWGQIGPGGFLPTNPDLADILGRTDVDFENLYFLDLSDPKFPDFQVPDFQISRNLAWAGLGPGRAWAGPGLGWAWAAWALEGRVGLGRVLGWAQHFRTNILST